MIISDENVCNVCTRNVYYDRILTSTNRDENKHCEETLQDERRKSNCKQDLILSNQLI